jgi:hypothetical protein
MSDNKIHYTIIRGADNEIELQGLRGKYVYGLLIGLGGVLLVGLVLFLLLPSPTLAGMITIAGAAYVFRTAFHLNKQYGRWGMEKKKIKDNLPSHVVLRKPASLKRKPRGKGQTFHA